MHSVCSVQVMSTLHALAQSGHTVVVSIHQPRSSIWSLFDDLVSQTLNSWTEFMSVSLPSMSATLQYWLSLPPLT
jgi:hypothetical protein